MKSKTSKPKPKPATRETSIAAPRMSRRMVAVLAVVGVLLVAGVGYLFAIELGVSFLGMGKKKRDAAKSAKDLPAPKLNPNRPPGPAPEGMVWIPGGEFYMGTEDDAEEFPDAGPVHLVAVKGFWMDKFEVTNEQFAKFVAATGFVTYAEKTPDARDFPDVPADKLKPFSIVFKKPGPKDRVDLRTHSGWWDIAYGACWKHPEGPASDIKGKEQYPVVHICYEDAKAYCKWAKKRLPTEAEWEFAARGGLDRQKFVWGDVLKPDGKWMANTWQGNFPHENTAEDGHIGLAPGGTYPANGYGLFDMAGNVWEWCEDYYEASFYAISPKDNPQGPLFGIDENEPGVVKRVQRGGSFLCAENYCRRYIVASRGKGEPNSAQNHAGFRCVQDVK
jgi:sulfatase modifying factor 1